MAIFNNFQDEICIETIEGVKYVEETYQYRLFKESVDEGKLENISERDLAEAIKIAEEHQKGNEAFVREKTHQLGTVAGIMSAPVGHDKLSIGLSLPGLASVFLYGYGRLFSKEVEMRQWIIDNGAYTEVTGNKWIDNWRYQWNIRHYYTNFLFKVIFAWVIYELSPRFYRLTIEYKLNQKAGNSFRELISELYHKDRDESGFDRFQEEEDAYPLKERGYGIDPKNIDNGEKTDE